MIDVSHQIAAVQRTVGHRTLAAGDARVVTISRSYPGPAADLWDACTNPERIPRWFLPITGELKPGGHYQLEGNAGGTVESCDPPHSFTATWEYGGEVSWIEVRVTAEGEQARLQLEHIAHVDDERWAEFGPGAVGIGWDLGLRGLGEHLASGGDAEPEATWVTSPDGLRFMTGSNEAWYAAAVADGADPAAARAAADRTIAAYTAG
jgi:uncharacterized protein YndB with AHSA1/START domain